MTALLVATLFAGQSALLPETALNDRMRKGVTPERNANVLIWKALGPTPEGGAGMPDDYFEWLGVPRPPKEGDYFVASWQYARDTLKLDKDGTLAFQRDEQACTRRPWSAAEYPQVAAWLAANEKPLAVIAEAVKRPDYFNPMLAKKSDKGRDSLVGALIPSVSKSRELVAALAALAMLRTAEKRHDAAWDDLLTALRLGRHIGRGGTLVEFLVGGACTWMASNAAVAHLEAADLTPAQLRARLKDLQALPPRPQIADKIDVGERHIFLDTLDLLRRGDDDLTPDQRAAWMTLDWSPAVQSAHTWFDRIVASQRHPARAERLAAFAAITAELDKLETKRLEPKGLLGQLAGGKDVPRRIVTTTTNLYLNLSVGAMRNVFDSADRFAQVERNLHVAVALAIYRREHGIFPPTLDVLAAVPNDIFTGRALVYRREGAGYVLYSVGPNGKDDGGRNQDDDRDCDDVVVRVPVKK